MLPAISCVRFFQTSTRQAKYGSTYAAQQLGLLGLGEAADHRGLQGVGQLVAVDDLRPTPRPWPPLSGSRALARCGVPLAGGGVVPVELGLDRRLAGPCR